jgi:hypothetical protein
VAAIAISAKVIVTGRPHLYLNDVLASTIPIATGTALFVIMILVFTPYVVLKVKGRVNAVNSAGRLHQVHYWGPLAVAFGSFATLVILSTTPSLNARASSAIMLASPLLVVMLVKSKRTFEMLREPAAVRHKLEYTGWRSLKSQLTSVNYNDSTVQELTALMCTACRCLKHFSQYGVFSMPQHIWACDNYMRRIEEIHHSLLLLKEGFRLEVCKTLCVDELNDCFDAVKDLLTAALNRVDKTETSGATLRLLRNMCSCGFRMNNAALNCGFCATNNHGYRAFQVEGILKKVVRLSLAQRQFDIVHKAIEEMCMAGQVAASLRDWRHTEKIVSGINQIGKQMLNDASITGEFVPLTQGLFGLYYVTKQVCNVFPRHIREQKDRHSYIAEQAAYENVQDVTWNSAQGYLAEVESRPNGKKAAEEIRNYCSSLFQH